DGYVHWPENMALEGLIEKYRPVHCISRQDAVFLTEVSCDGEKYGAESANSELIVITEEDTLYQKSDLQWLSELERSGAESLYLNPPRKPRDQREAMSRG